MAKTVEHSETAAPLLGNLDALAPEALRQRLRELQSHQIDLEDQIEALRQTLRDITEQKQAGESLQISEQQYQNLASKIRVGIYIMRSNPDGASWLEYASSRMAEIFGVPVESLIADAQTVPRAIHPDSLDSFWTSTREGIQQRQPFEWNGRAVVAGSVKWLHFESTPEPMVCGDILWHGFVVDITERKQLEAERAELEVQNRQLQKAECLGRMAGSIAHHFNNKLQVVMGTLELISEAREGVDTAKFVRRAKQATENAAEVSRLMLLYLGQSSLEQEPRFLSEVCCGSLPQLRDSLPETLSLEVDCPFPGPVIHANADQIGQVLSNLVANARDAMGDVGGCIHLGLTTCAAAEIPSRQRFPVGWEPQGSHYACLEVRDTGCGIEDANIEMLFDPFFSTKFIGQGLGLSVVLGIVRTHGGAVTVASQQGKGSVFQVYWPITTETAPSLVPPGIEGFNSEVVGAILLVDDDAMLLDVTGEMIERMGFRVLTAKDGAEALEVFRHHQNTIRCVITDLTMPHMDGWGTLEALRQLAPSLPVILTSGYDKAHVLSGAHPHRPQAFLGKPFGLQQLRDAVGQVLTLEEKPRT